MISISNKTAIALVLALNLGLVTNLQQVQAQQVFESPTAEFRIANLPTTWVVEEGQVGYDAVDRMIETRFNFEDLGTICHSSQAVPAIGGNYDCERNASRDPTPENPAEITVYKFPELKFRPEFRAVEHPTPDDVISLYITFGRELSESLPGMNAGVQFAVVNQTDTTTRISSTGQTVPAKLATLTQTVFNDITPTVPDHVDHLYGLFTVSPDGNQGYALLTPRWDVEKNPSTTPPPEIAQILQSFELVS